MDPLPLAMNHPTALLLKHYTTQGCSVDCGPDWTTEHIHALLQRGPHVSATTLEAIKAFQDKCKAKIAQGYAHVVRYRDIKHNRLAKLKLSPVAMIPHKSWLFRTILNLSFGICLSWQEMPSVNDSTKKMAPAEAMVQLRQCLQRIIATLADNANTKNPFLFAKLDIKDGFWHLAINEDNTWNFCYVMPTTMVPESINDRESR